MNEDTIKGKWKQLRGKIKQTWSQLTDDDLGQLEGDRDYLVGKVQERYGIAREEAATQVNKLERSLRSGNP